MTHRHQIRTLTALLGSVAVAAVAGVSPVAAHRAASSAVRAAQPDHLITLVTGERVLESAGPNGAVAFNTVSKPATPMVTFEANSAWYVLPAVVMHSLGVQLDPTLFRIDALIQAEAAAPGQVPVQVSWHGTSAPAMPWLVHPVSVSAGTTDGVVTASSGAGLQSALASGALTNIDRVSLAAAVSAARQRAPGFTLHTLTVNGIDFKGAPDTGDLAILLNTGNALDSAGVGLEQWYKGIFKVSVPDGHYAMIGDFVQFSGTGAGGPPPSGQEHIAILDFTVHGNTAVTVDARTATARIAVATPMPTGVGSASVTWQRDSAGQTGGTSFGSAWSFGAGLPPFAAYVSPTPAPAVGTQGWVASFHLDSPAASPTAYSYDLTYGSSGAISAEQRHAVKTAQLATVATRYSSDVAGNPEAEIRQSFFPWQFIAFGTFDNFNGPFDRTEYVLAASDLLWLQQVVADANSFGGLSQDLPRVLAPATAYGADWNRGPIGPGVSIDTGAGAVYPVVQACPACTEAGMLELAVYPYGDNPPGHTGFPNFPAPGLTETDTYTLWRDGVPISAGPDPLGISVPIPSGAATYQLKYSVVTSAPWRTLSTSQTTTWGFSSPGATSAPPPTGWVCFSGTSVGCSVVALMLPSYQLPEDDTGHVASGSVTFQLGISHMLGASIATTSAAVSISFDGGSTWVAAKVSPNGANNYAVSYSDPSHAGTAAIRISVTDADGGVLDQTILNAYAFP